MSDLYDNIISTGRLRYRGEELQQEYRCWYAANPIEVKLIWIDVPRELEGDDR